MSRKKTSGSKAADASGAERAYLEHEVDATLAGSSTGRQRLPAELLYARELSALRSVDAHDKPAGWLLSPRGVRDFLCGLPKPLGDGAGESITIERKFFGDDPMLERAIVTLASQRGLMLIGEPGTAKSMLSELLTAAVSGISHLTIQGSAGTSEDQIKYGWNYALLLAQGPSPAALVPAPLHVGMATGRLVRFEEITRCPLEVQDVIIPILSERLMIIPELTGEDGLLFAQPGFNIIATANTRDRGVNEMSAALKRRFNFETVRPIADLRMELELVHREVQRQLAGMGVRVEVGQATTELLVTTFHELRGGRTTDGVPIQSAGGVVSTAEAVAVGVASALHAKFFDAGVLEPEHLVANLEGTLLKESEDRKAIDTYFDVTVKARAADQPLWKRYYQAHAKRKSR